MACVERLACPQHLYSHLVSIPRLIRPSLRGLACYRQSTCSVVVSTDSGRASVPGGESSDGAQSLFLFITNAWKTSSDATMSTVIAIANLSELYHATSGWAAVCIALLSRFTDIAVPLDWSTLGVDDGIRPADEYNQFKTSGGVLSNVLSDNSPSCSASCQVMA